MAFSVMPESSWDIANLVFHSLLIEGNYVFPFWFTQAEVLHSE